MPEPIPFQLRLTGDLAVKHRFQGYDGYMAIAGFAWTLSLVSNYVETGEIRQRGDFPGRHLVQAEAPKSGSVLVDLSVFLTSHPSEVFGGLVTGVGAGALLTSLVARVINRNLGEESAEADRVLGQLLERRGGDVEALVAIAESPLRQTHSVVGRGADEIEISGGFNIINRFNYQTKEYVSMNVEDRERRKGEFSVAAFNVNSGYGSVFDRQLGRVVPISMSREVLRQCKGVFSWGLDQYATGKGGRITMQYTRILSMDGRPKRYVVVGAVSDRA